MSAVLRPSMIWQAHWMLEQVPAWRMNEQGLWHSAWRRLRRASCGERPISLFKLRMAR